MKDQKDSDSPYWAEYYYQFGRPVWFLNAINDPEYFTPLMKKAVETNTPVTREEVEQLKEKIKYDRLYDENGNVRENMELKAAEYEYVKKFHECSPFVIGISSFVRNKDAIPKIYEAIERGYPISEEEESRFYHELWPDVYDENGKEIKAIKPENHNKRKRPQKKS